MMDLATLMVLFSVGIIGVVEWIKEVVKGIRNKCYQTLYKAILSFVFSIGAGLLIKCIKYPEASFYISVPLALGVLSIVQLGYDNILKRVNSIIDTVLDKLTSK